MKKYFDPIKANQTMIGFLIVPIPILIYWIYWTLNPSYWFNADPAAIYFVDSLSVFIGQPYGFVDHPGTPIHIIGSLLLVVAYPFFNGTEPFVNFFLTHPDVFFLLANVFLLAINLFCAILFYKTAASTLKHTPILGAIAISLLAFTLHPHGFSSLTFWSHNSLNYPIGILLLILLYRETRSSKVIQPYKLFILGLANGIFATAQLYFLAWLISSVLIVFIFSLRLNNNIRQAIKAGFYITLGGIVGIISMLIPIYHALPRFTAFILDIINHLGLYGTGESGIYSLSLIPLSIQFWWNSIRTMVLVLALTVTVLILFINWHRKTPDRLTPGDYAMLIGLIFHVGLVLIVLTKAALKLRYSLSLAASLPVLVFIVLKLLEQTTWNIRKPLIFFYLATIAGVVISLISQKSDVDKRAFVETDALKAKTEAVSRLAMELGVPEEQIRIVHTYAVPLQCAGILQGANWTGNFHIELGRICPNQYAIWDSPFEMNTAVPVKDIDDIGWDLVIWPGNGTDLPDYLYSIGATTIPDSWHVARSRWFFIHSEILDE